MSETATYGGIRDKREFNDTLNDIEAFVPMSEGSLETIYHETGFAIEPITLDDGVTVDGLTCACYLYAANLGGENGQAIIIRKLIDGQRIYGYVSREELLEVGITDFTVISTANSTVDEWLLANTKTVGPTEVTFTTISAKIRSLISKSNAKTGVNNADLTTAVDKLIAGYGTGIDTSDATATADTMLDGYTAYIDGEKIEGNIPTYDGSFEGGSAYEVGDGLPLIAMTDEEMEDYASYSSNVGKLVKFEGNSEEYVTGEMYLISSGSVDYPQYMPEIPQYSPIEVGELPTEVIYKSAVYLCNGKLYMYEIGDDGGTWIEYSRVANDDITN